MATTLPQVTVGPAKDRPGFTATCSCGRWQIRRPTRPDADLDALEHRASHATPLHEDDGRPWHMDEVIA